MSVGDFVVAALLTVGVGLELLCSLGVLAMRGAFDRLHYTGPASLGAALISAAIVVREGFSTIGIKAALVAVFLLISSPILVHATGRAALMRERGDLRVQPDEMEEDTS